MDRSRVPPQLLQPSTAFTARCIELRAERPTDALFCAELYHAARLAELVLLPWSLAAKREFLSEQFRLQDEHFARHERGADRLIVEQHGVAVGRLYIARERGSWRILDIGLVPSARSQGIGTALIAWVCDGARASGADAIELQVAIDNARAQSLYQRLGFTPIESAAATHLRLSYPLS